MMGETERRWEMFVKGVHIFYKSVLSILIARLYNSMFLVFIYCNTGLILQVYAICHIADQNTDITLHNFTRLFKDAFNISCYVPLNYRIIKLIINCTLRARKQSSDLIYRASFVVYPNLAALSQRKPATPETAMLSTVITKAIKRHPVLSRG